VTVAFKTPKVEWRQRSVQAEKVGEKHGGLYPLVFKLQRGHRVTGDNGKNEKKIKKKKPLQN